MNKATSLQDNSLDYIQEIGPQKVPVLDPAQLLGFKRPPDMITDPTTHQRAMRIVMEAFQALKINAQKDGWDLILVSGYRSFNYQTRLWNMEYDQTFKEPDLTEEQKIERVLDYTSLPGLSRHHWGTELDISERSLRGQLFKDDPKLPKKVRDFYEWMEENAPRYGFCKTYNGTSGVINDEPWHWSFKAYSRIYERQLQGLSDFSMIFDPSVEGYDYVREHFSHIYEREMQSVDPNCLK